MMSNQIKDATKRSRACLPYRMVFSLIFTKFSVRLEGEDSKRLMHRDHYNEWSLHWMGYRKVDDMWVRWGSGQESIGDEEEADAPAIPFLPPLPVAPSGSMAPSTASPSTRPSTIEPLV